MGIGALAGLSLLETLLGLEARGDRVVVQPCLPSSLDGFTVDNLTCMGERVRLEVSRGQLGSVRASTPLELQETVESTSLRLDDPPAPI